MKRIGAAIAAGALLFAANPAAAWERITTEQQFVDEVAGRTIFNAAGSSWVLHPDGRLVGTWDGHSMTGRWEWHQAFLCRNVRIGGSESGTDCQIIEVQGDRVRITRDQGRGEASEVSMR